jgi:predicted nucleic acid-binding protein
VRLAADASALVAEALRARGEDLITDDDLDLFIAAPTWSEVEHEVTRRINIWIRQGRVVSDRREYTLRRTLTLLSQSVTVVAEGQYAHYEAEARDRIPQDAKDWPTLALALHLGIGIWTVDRDFFGCGAPVWTTHTPC